MTLGKHFGESGRASVARISALVPLISMLACGGEERVSGPVLHELLLTEPASESGEADLLGQAGMSHFEALEHLRRAAENDDVRGLLLQIGPMGSAFARVSELARAAAAVRDAGKPVHCHLRTTDNAGYVLAALACERISMTPAGLVDLVGVRAQAIYAKPLLDRVGLHAEMLQAGRFKGAADALTKSDMPETTRQTLNAILDALHAQVLDALQAGRGIPAERAQALVDGGPYSAHQARVHGLVDDVGFDDEARQHARKGADVERVEQLGEPERPEISLSTLLSTLQGERSERPDRDYIRLVVIDGAITTESSGAGSFGGAADRFVPELRALANDDHCKGVVIRIDSPGGSALASDRMWHAVRMLAKRKPAFVSIGDMAASGGYYIASAGTRIFAEDSSLVGSIGVVGGKLSIAGLAERAGVQVVQLQRGARAGWSSPLFDLTDGERRALRDMIDATYRLFLRRVMQGRALPLEQIEAKAEGRLMVAAEARAGRLVDEQGGLGETLAALRAETALPDEAPISVWPKRQSPLARLLGGQVQALSPGASQAPLPMLDKLIDVVDPEHDFAMLRPWLAGESAAAALPYHLSLK